MKATLVVIQNDADHAQAKVLVEKLMRSRDAAGQARMVAQAHLMEAYERGRWPRRTPALPELLIYLMDQHGLSRADLIPLLGTPSRVSEILNGKRELSMSMLRKLRERFHISADLLIPHAPAGCGRVRRSCNLLGPGQSLNASVNPVAIGFQSY
jgi:HTH-type transcriptional regulator / antitoxin HigA